MNIFRAREIELIYPDIWRIFISGSSSAGKTYFAKQLLSTGLLKIDRIYYFHPDIQEEFPVDWCDYFKDIPIVCEAGLPTIEELNEMPPNSVVVLDDLFTECAESKLMSYLFRVLSSKKKLHLVIMTQRYFDMGSKGLNLRNCSNYHVLMSNTDVRTNHRVGFSMGLDKEIKLAEKVNKSKLYPYIVIDRTNQARVNGVQVYTDILSKHKEVIMNESVFSVVPAAEFKRKHELTSDGFAKKRAKMDYLDMLDDPSYDDDDSLFDPDQYSDSDHSTFEDISPAWKEYFSKLNTNSDESTSEVEQSASDTDTNLSDSDDDEIDSDSKSNNDSDDNENSDGSDSDASDNSIEDSDYGDSDTSNDSDDSHSYASDNSIEDSDEDSDVSHNPGEYRSSSDDESSDNDNSVYYTVYTSDSE